MWIGVWWDLGQRLVLEVFGISIRVEFLVGKIEIVDFGFLGFYDLIGLSLVGWIVLFEFQFYIYEIRYRYIYIKGFVVLGDVGDSILVLLGCIFIGNNCSYRMMRGRLG